MSDGQVSLPIATQSEDALQVKPEEEGKILLTTLSLTRWWITVAALAGLTLIVGMACLTFGAENIKLGSVIEALGTALNLEVAHESRETIAEVIILQVRLPRIFLGFLVGSSLAVVGVGLQALLRNPLADPYVLGISSGSAFGATLGILFGVSGTIMGFSILPLWAFVGGLFSIFLVYRMSLTYRMLSVHTLLLAGVILNALFSALIMFVVSIADPSRAFKMMMWLLGTLSSPNFLAVVALSVYLVGGGIVLFGLARSLNILTLGEEPARALGVNIELVKKIMFLIAALMTGAVVSLAGLIGFVGMVVPHAVRMIVGADHRLLIPASGFVGGIFLMLADTVARTVLAPTELPVGVVTALIGGPVFMYLLVTRRAGVAL